MKTKIVTLLALLLFATGIVNAAEIVGGTSTTIGGGTYNPSTKVHVKILSASSSYSASSAHESGTTGYAAGGGTGYAGDVSKIYSKTCAANPCGTDPAVVPASATALPTGTWN